MWVMDRVDGTESSVFSGIYSELCGLWGELKVQRQDVLRYRERIVWVMERVEGTEIRVYSGI